MSTIGETQSEFDRRVLSFISGDALADAKAALADYLDNYTGAWFETTADGDTDRFTANDLVAVTMLGVEVPARAAHWILTDGADELAALLASIHPASLEIWHADADLSPQSSAWQLWRLVKDRHGIGPTISSKLLAAKRPHLFPINDSVVGAALGIGKGDYWALWQTLLRSDSAQQVHDAVAQLKRKVPGAEHLSTLRVLDIIVWMQSRGDEDH